MSEKDWTLKIDDFSVRHWYDNNNYLRKRQWPEGFTVYYDENRRWHRLDGPAREDPNWDFREWYIHDKKVECKTQEEFERWIKLKAFW